MGIDELARRCGTTVRTIREYQTQGVLPRPTRAGRVAVYDEGHVRRLRAIARLQERGYSLAGIADLLDAWETGSSLPAVLGLDDTSPTGVLDEAPVIVSVADLTDALPGIFTSTRLARRAVRVGLVEAVASGDPEQFVVRSPALVQLAAALVDAGLSATAVLDFVGVIRAAAMTMAEPAIALTIDHLASDDTPADRTVKLLQRTRGLLAQAAATAVVNQVGVGLEAHLRSQPALAEVLGGVRVGQVRDATSPGSPRLRPRM